jgi:hypothetical protein
VSEEGRVEPLVFVDGNNVDGREMWMAWIDYAAQGSSAEDALDNFAAGWRATVAANRDAGITPSQMMDARYPDTAGENAELKAEIERLNASIETMHAERMTFVAEMNAELDRLRNALAERGADRYWP